VLIRGGGEEFSEEGALGGKVVSVKAVGDDRPGVDEQGWTRRMEPKSETRHLFCESIEIRMGGEGWLTCRSEHYLVSGLRARNDGSEKRKKATAEMRPSLYGCQIADEDEEQLR
jgi:hypothetical protein